MIDFKFSLKKLLTVSLFIIVLFGSLILRAQSSIYAPLPPILKRALQYPGTLNISTFNTQTLIQPKDLPPSYKTNAQQYVKTPEGLFLFVDGTGRIYHYNPTHSNWNRIDSTVFMGYNFGALFFHMGNTFYNFGGHGFWNSYGNIRNFNPYSHEWDAKATSENIVFVNLLGNQFHYLDTANQDLWILGPNYEPNHLKNIFKNTPYKNTIWKLHVQTGDWTQVGELKDTGFNLLTQFYNGFYYNGGIVDLKQNKYLKASDELTQKIFAINSTSKKDNFFSLAFSIDSTIYFGNLEDRIDSIQLHASDFIDTGIPVYTPVRKPALWQYNDLKWLGYIFLIAIGMMLGWWMAKRKNIPNNLSTSLPTVNETPQEEEVLAPVVISPKTVIFKSGKDLARLDEKEQRLVDHLLQNCNVGRSTTIEEINRILGVAQRSHEIQKRMRSDMINSINQKAQLLLELNEPLISKKRSEHDKRSFEYFIESALMPLAHKL